MSLCDIKQQLSLYNQWKRRKNRIREVKFKAKL